MIIRLNAIECVMRIYPDGSRHVKAQSQNVELIKEINCNIARGLYDNLTTEQMIAMNWLLDHFTDHERTPTDYLPMQDIDLEALEQMLEQVNKSVGCTYPHAALIVFDETESHAGGFMIANNLYQLIYDIRTDFMAAENGKPLSKLAAERYSMILSKMPLLEEAIDRGINKGSLLDMEG